MPFKWIFRLTFFFLAIQYSHQQTDCSYSDNCDTSSFDAVIICGKSFGGQPETDCGCTEEDGITPCTDSGLDFTGVTATTMDAAKCAELCTSSVESECMFWKFNDANAFQKYCHLMNKDQCQAADEASCEDPDCDGGNLDGVAGKPTCDPDTNNGPPTCPGPIVTLPEDVTKFYQKWRCFISVDNNIYRDIVDFDMYEADAKMPEGGYCKLATDDGGSCKKTDKDFRFDCKVDPADSSLKWMPLADLDPADTADVLAVDGELQDLDCSAARLEFTADGLASQSGRDIHCLHGGVTEEDDGLGGPITTFIPAENDCLMTCDDYSVLLFYTDYDKDSVDGGRGWFFEVFGVTMDPVKMANADILDCWGAEQ